MATWDQQMSINAKGVFLGLRTILPIMQQQKSGSIVNISSISGIVGQSFVHMGYNAAKGAVRTMTKTVAVQYAAGRHPLQFRASRHHAADEDVTTFGRSGDPREDDPRHSDEA